MLNDPVNNVDPLGLWAWARWIEPLYWIFVDNSTPHPGATQLLISGLTLDDYGPGKEHVESNIRRLTKTIDTIKTEMIRQQLAALEECDKKYANDPCAKKKCRNKAYDGYTDSAAEKLWPLYDELQAYKTIQETFFKY